MPRRVVTVEDVATARDGELRLPADAIITDQAREFAAEHGIRLVVEGDDLSASGEVASQQSRRDSRGTGRGSVALGSDHAGYELKEYLKRFLDELGYTVEDLGTHSTESVDYPDFARAVAEAVVASRAWRGIVVDAAGIGSAITANKVPGARAA